MELDEIATYVEVVRASTYTLAAERLGVPKSTVSRRITRLEETLGVRLLKRTARSIEPTEAGMAYFERVAPAIEALGDARHAVRDLSGRPQGTLNLSAPVDVGHAFLADLVMDFMKACPDVAVRVELSQRRVDLVREGFDAALRAGSVGDDSLIAKRLGSVELGLYTSTEHAREFNAIGHPRDLVGRRFVGFSFGVAPSHEAPVIELRHAKEAPYSLDMSGQLRANDFAFVQSAALRGAGIALLPCYLAREDVAARRLVRVLPQWRGGGSELALVYASARYLPAKVAAFRDFVGPWLARHSWLDTSTVASGRRSSGSRRDS